MLSDELFITLNLRIIGSWSVTWSGLREYDTNDVAACEASSFARLGVPTVRSVPGEEVG